jgi:hypothetical protein
MRRLFSLVAALTTLLPHAALATTQLSKRNSFSIESEGKFFFYFLIEQ